MMRRVFCDDNRSLLQLGDRLLGRGTMQQQQQQQTVS
jgi:hypothetical protein